VWYSQSANAMKLVALPAETLTTVSTSPYQVGFAVGLSPDGKTALAGLVGSNGSSGSLDWYPAEKPPDTYLNFAQGGLIVPLDGGAPSTAYHKVITAYSASSGAPRSSFVSVAPTFFPDGKSVLMVSNEAFLLEEKKQLENASYQIDPEVGGEFYQTIPGSNAATALTTKSKTSAGGNRGFATVSPSSTRVLYTSGEGLRMMQIGSSSGVVLRGSNNSGLLTGCWLRAPNAN
jgi:hypothetical protein